MYNNIYNFRTIFIRIVYGTFVIRDLCPKFEQCFPSTMGIKENAKGFYLFGCNCRSYHAQPTEKEETLRPCLPNRWHIHDFLEYIRRKKFSMWLYITVVFTLLIVQKILFFFRTRKWWGRGFLWHRFFSFRWNDFTGKWIRVCVIFSQNRVTGDVFSDYFIRSV